MMTHLELKAKYVNDPPKIIYHSVHPDPCYRQERAGTPIGNGIYHATRYKMSEAVEVGIYDAKLIKTGLELKIEFLDEHTEKFLIPLQDVADFIGDINPTFLQKFILTSPKIQKVMDMLPTWLKPSYKNIRLSAFLNKYNENEIFGLIALTQYEGNKNLYQDRRNNVYFITHPDGIGIGGRGGSYLGDPDILDRIGDHQRRNHLLMRGI